MSAGGVLPVDNTDMEGLSFEAHDDGWGELQRTGQTSGIYKRVLFGLQSSANACRASDTIVNRTFNIMHLVCACSWRVLADRSLRSEACLAASAKLAKKLCRSRKGTSPIYDGSRIQVKNFLSCTCLQSGPLSDTGTDRRCASDCSCQKTPNPPDLIR